MKENQSIKNSLEVIKKALKENNIKKEESNLLVLDKLVKEDGTIENLEDNTITKDEVKKIMSNKISEVFDSHLDEWLEKNIPDYLEKYFSKKK